MTAGVSTSAPDSRAGAVAAPDDAARRARLRACTILLVDDEAANLDLLEALLAGEGFASLVRTTDPREVPALVARHAPDLVLLDLHMPHRHGLEVLGELRRSTPPDEYRPVLVLTADATWEARERALARGASDFVTKPFEMTEVLLRVENLLDARTLQRAERAARARAEAAEARAALLAEWSRVLAAALDPATALAHLARLLVPRWAAACVVALRDGGATSILGGDADAGPAVAALGRVARAALDAPSAAHEAGMLVAPIATDGGVPGAIAVVPAGALDAATLADVADRAARAVERARLLAAAEMATRERERLLAVVAHDLRNPLGAVSIYAEMLANLQPDDGGDAYTRGALSAIVDNVRGMQHLVEDLLDVAALRGGALRIVRAERRVGDVFDEAERMLRPLAESRGSALEVRGEDGAGDVVAAIDGPRVVQLLSNLVGNALTHASDAGPVTVSYVATVGELAVSVTDAGPGIAEEELPHLFTAFWRRERRERRGAGLGLWIARAIVEAHDGELRIASRAGEGTTFRFTIPFAPATRRWED